MTHAPKDRTYYLVAVMRRYPGKTADETYNHYYIISYETGARVARAALWNGKDAIEWNARLRHFAQAYMITMSEAELQYATTHQAYNISRNSL